MITNYINGQIHTFDSNCSIVDSFAVRDGRFATVGSNGHSAHETIDLAGATVVPGFIDAHIHLIDFGLMLQTTVDLVGCRSLEEMKNRLRDRAEKSKSQWLLGHGFDQELFGTGIFPTRQDLDDVVRDRPLVVRRICGHAAVGNSLAFEMSEGLPPESYESGLVTEDDVGRLRRGAPAPSDEEIDSAILTAGQMAARLGVTGVHCLLADMRQYDRLDALNRQGRLPIRFTAQIPYEYLDEACERGLRTQGGDDWLRVGAMKLFADGSFGARTAAMIAEYTDDPGNYGLLLLDESELKEMISRAQNRGFQCAIHAIGDKAVEVVVDAIEGALEGKPNTLRHRIEHASQMTQVALEKMAALQIPAAVQPQFVLTDFWTSERVGPTRYKWSYPFKTMLSAGIPCAMSSDCYVERLDPYELIHRAWVRDSKSQAECLSPAETISSYTAGSAYAEFAEKTMGSIESDKLADFIIFNQALFDLAPNEILALRPSQVVIGGQPVSMAD